MTRKSKRDILKRCSAVEMISSSDIAGHVPEHIGLVLGAAFVAPFCF